VSVNLPRVKLSRHNSSNVSVEENDAAGFLLEITAAAHNHEDRQIVEHKSAAMSVGYESAINNPCKCSAQNNSHLS